MLGRVGYLLVMVVGSWGRVVVAAAGAVGNEYSCPLLPKEKMAPQRESSTHAKKKKKRRSGWEGRMEEAGMKKSRASSKEQCPPTHPPPNTRDVKEGILEMQERGREHFVLAKTLFALKIVWIRFGR